MEDDLQEEDQEWRLELDEVCLAQVELLELLD